MIECLEKLAIRALVRLLFCPRFVSVQPVDDGKALLRTGITWRQEDAVRPLCIHHLSGNQAKIDFAYPGGHLYLHRGSEEAVRFIAQTERFRVCDIPGAIGDDVRLALAARFVESGILEPDDA